MGGGSSINDCNCDSSGGHSDRHHRCSCGPPCVIPTSYICLVVMYSNRNFFFFSFLSSKVRTCIEPEPNLLNLVLSVLVHSSPFCLPQVQFWFKVLQDTLENRTKLNFGIPTQA